MPDQKSSGLELVNRDLEYQKCMYYLMARAGDIPNKNGEKKKHSMEEIAEAIGFTDRRAVYYAVDRWERDGILEEARRAYMVPKMEEIQLATDEVMHEWPEILREMVKMAKGTNTGTIGNPRTRWEIGAWLYEAVVVPELDKQVASGATEATYAEALLNDFDPINITPGVDAFVPKQDKKKDSSRQQ